MCSNPCESEVTCFRPESNRGPYGLLTFVSAALSTTELWWQLNHRKSFRTLFIYVWMYMYIYMHMYMYMCPYIYVCVCVCVCIYIYVDACMRVYVYMYICICICVYASPYAFLQRVRMHSQVLLNTMHVQVCTLDRCCEHQRINLLHTRYRMCICAIYIHAYMHICMHIFVCMHIYIYIYMYVCIYMYMHICMDVYICICVCVCVCVYIYMCMYVYIQIYIYLYRMYVQFVWFSIGEWRWGVSTSLWERLLLGVGGYFGQEER